MCRGEDLVYAEGFGDADIESKRKQGPGLGQPVGRQVWIDNLRVAVIVGVVVAHVSTAYILDIDWYYEEQSATAVERNRLLADLRDGPPFRHGAPLPRRRHLHATVLRSQGRTALRARSADASRASLVLFVIVFEPLTDFVGYRGMGGDDGFIAYLDRWRRDDADLSVMWFVAALLAFSLVYAAWRSVRPARLDRAGRLGAVELVGFGAFVAVGSFFVRLVWPFASNCVFGLNLWEFPQMMAMFGLDALAAEHGWLDDALPDRFWRNCGLATVVGGVMLLGILGAIRLGADEDPFFGGAYPQALALPIAEAVTAIAVSLWALEWFRRRWNHAGPIVRALGRASFAAYIVHAPVVVLLAVGLSSVPVPVEIKFLAVFALGAAASFGLGWLVTRL